MSSQPNLPTPFNLDAIRARLADSKGPEFWRSLEEVAETPEFQSYLDHEFTDGASEWSDPVSRRRIVQLLGASLGLAGLTACTKQPPEKIVPYVNAPEDIVPGKPLFFATAIPLGGVADGVLVESHMGRPTKIEGNPQHPSSLGSTSVYTQAATLGLYDPDRSQAVLREGRHSTWNRFQETANMLREQLLSTKGAGFRLLTETVTSPTLAAWFKDFAAAFPEARIHHYEPNSRDSARTGAKLAFGEAVNTVYSFDKADVVVSLDADFMAALPGSVRYARDFMSRRKPAGEATKMNRLYVLEPSPSITGAAADHRLALSSAEVENFARALAAELGCGTPAATTKASAWLKAVAKDLGEHKGASIVVAGDQQSPAVHALAHAINAALGNVGKTLSYTDPLEAFPVDQYASLKQLVADMDSGNVNTVLVAGGNPLYNVPADVNFKDSFRKVKLRIHLGEYDDETSAVCHWHIPMAHALESWGDFRAYDGAITIQQPLIAPLYEGRQLIEILAVLLDKGGREVRDLVKENWAKQSKAADFDDQWQKWVHDGWVAGSALPAKNAAVRKELAASLPAAPAAGGLEVNFRPCPSVYDGRFANNGWLQELPRPLTKVTWDNVVLMSPATSQKLGIQRENPLNIGYTVAKDQIIELTYQGRKVKGPAWILPGHADDCVTIHLGYGRTRCGKIADGVGFNVNAIRTAEAPWSGSGLTVARTGDLHQVAVTHGHHSMEGRKLVRYAGLEEYKKQPDFAQEEEKGKKLFSMYPDWEYKSYAWGMAIDLNACIGCNACTIACQAENNIPVVGKEQVMRQREMHWIRVDRYFEGSLDNPSIHHQPVTCMHCENAPCEGVCPVAATAHSEEGLNQMTYNRCVGTRYCANNCPYKVRRFNFFLYSDWDTQSLYGLRNPNVTVRSRGVMEKCTYCVQRINFARIEAEKDSRKIKDGEIITACQAVCPTQAISFGDINDPTSNIARIKKDPRNYSILTDLQTRPRTSYLARLRNPNPELEKS
jgi:molybdopterin-containing oxidoreductase family iron-sulfur binding subunit